MKKIYWLLCYICVNLPLLGQQYDNIENFEGHNCPDVGYSYGLYKSLSNNYWWEYVNSRNASASNEINGKSLLLRVNTGYFQSSQIKGGITDLSITVNRGWVITSQRSFKVEVIPENGDAIVEQQFSFSGEVFQNRDFTISNIGIEGLFKIKISNLTTTTAIVIDELKWKSFNNVNETWETNILSGFDANPATSNLYDFSYAGYKSGDVDIPEVPVVANVLDYGAVADDQQDDGVAFQAAMDYASGIGGGAVLIPKGRFDFNTEGAAIQFIKLPSNVVLRGSGNAEDGTTLYLNNYIESNYGQPLIDVKNEGFDDAPRISVTQNAKKGDYFLSLQSTEVFNPGDGIRLRMYNPYEDGVRQDYLSRIMTAPLEPDIAWTSYGRIAPFNCYFEIEEVVDANTIKLKQPLMYDISSQYYPKVYPINFTSGVGVENLRLKSGFQGGYSHHKNWEVDYGWCGIGINNAKDSWVKDVVLTDFTWDMSVTNSLNVTVQNVVVLGVDSHHGIKCKSSSFVLVKDSYFKAYRTHPIGGSQESHGNVFTNIGIDSENGMIDCHGGGFMSHNLFEKITNSHADSGGAEKDMPHSGQYNVFWNIISNVSQGYRKPGLDFFSGLWNYPDYYNVYGANHQCYKLYPKSILVGVYHPDYLIEVDNITGDQNNDWITIEGFNQEGVFPSSLYAYQFNKRKSEIKGMTTQSKINYTTKVDSLFITYAKKGANRNICFTRNLGMGTISIYNIQGKLKYRDYQNIQEGEQLPVLLTKAVYIVQVDSNLGLKTQKIVVY